MWISLVYGSLLILFIPRRVRFAPAHRVAAQFDAVSVVNEAVEDGVGVSGIANLGMPAIHGDLRGNDRRAAVVAIVDDLHQVATLLGSEPGHDPVVEDQQSDPSELGQQPGGPAVDASEGELIDKPGQSLIAHREPVPRRPVTEGASDKTFAGTGRAEDQDVVVLVQPAAAGQGVDQAAIETARRAVIDIL